MERVLLNTMDTRGSASTVAYRLHQGLRLPGHKSRMFVRWKHGDDPTVRVCRKPSGRWAGRKYKKQLRLPESDHTPAEQRLLPYELFSDDRSDWMPMPSNKCLKKRTSQ
jgi:hypothetical protein